MKKGFLAGLVTAAVLAMLYAGAPKPGPTGIEEPLPIEVNQPTEGLIKPVLVNVAKPWIITNDTGTHIVTYYQRVKMPDGSVQELKIKPAVNAKPIDPVPDAKTWQVLADKLWAAQVAAELNKPKPCPYCGGTGVLP